MKNVVSKNVLCGFFFLGTAAFAQATSDNVPSDNVAADALRKRVLSMNLLNPPAPRPVVLAGVVMRPRVCAVPLLNAVPPGTTDTMEIVEPAISTRGDVVQFPAPSCGDK
jgi:hypothetical protein